MNQPHLYSRNNDLQVTDAIYVLNKYFHVIRWKKEGGDSNLDVGCGDGYVTADLLYPLLPQNMRKLIGVDVSHEMIEFAKSHHSKRKISYMLLDISTKELDVELKEEFDHIFSFYCLHWVQDQRQCLFNLHNMLYPGGDIFLVFLAKDITYQVYENLSKHQIWAEYMRDVKKIVCPYHHSKDPAKEFRSLLTEVGFEVHFCKVVDRIYTFEDIFSYKKWIMAINPFIKRMSDDLKENFTNDMLREMKKLNHTVLRKDNHEETVQMRQKIFVVHAIKSV